MHKETSTFTIHVELSAEFDENYEGDNDGYAWLERFRSRVQPQLLRAAYEAIRAEAGFQAVPTSRGHSPDEHATIAVTYKDS